MSRITKLVSAAAFAMVLLFGAAQAGEALEFSMPATDAEEARTQVWNQPSINTNDPLPRSQELEYAMPATDAQEARTQVWDQPSRATGGVVSDHELAMPYKEGMPDGRDQPVVGR